MSDETQQWLTDTAQPDYIERLRTALKRRKMSQREFADRCGCSLSNMSIILNGRHYGGVPKYVWRTARSLFGDAALAQARGEE